MNFFKFIDEQNIIIRMLRLPESGWQVHLRIIWVLNEEEIYESGENGELYCIFGSGSTPVQALVDLCYRIHGKTLLDSNSIIRCEVPMILTL